MEALVRWLGEQLDEDERSARATLWDDGDSQHWIAYDRGPRDHPLSVRWVVIDGMDEGVTDSQPQAADDEAVAQHIARHDPARVLAEVKAKRQILRLHSYTGGHECSTLDHNGEIDHCTWVMDSEACTTLRLLALPYADHPDYRQEWRP